MAYIGQFTYSSVDGATADSKKAGRFQAGSSFTANYMGARTAGLGSGEKMRLGIYADNTGEPGALLGSTGEITGKSTADSYWVHAKFSTGVSITSGTWYWLAWIVDSNASVFANTGGTSRYNNDTYSNGFADPFGSTTSSTSLYAIYASDVFMHYTDGDLSVNGAVVETSAGTKLSVILNLDASPYIQVFNVSADPPVMLLEGQSPTTVHGGDEPGAIHAAIDSSDAIHVVSACTTEQTRDVAYCILSNPDGTPSWGTWEEAANYTEAAPSNPGVSISIDSNDKPHIGYVDAVKQTGATQDNVYYTEKTGASWATPTKIGLRADKNDSYDTPRITLRNGDNIEIIYRFVTDGDLAYQTYTGTWSGESVYTEALTVVGGVIATTGGTTYRYYVVTGAVIEENNVSTSYATDTTNATVSPVLVDDSDRYIFYLDTGDDVHLISNDGGGWTDEGDLQVGTYNYVIAEWAYNNENQSGEINYIYADTSNLIYFDTYLLTVRRIFITSF